MRRGVPLQALALGCMRMQAAQPIGQRGAHERGVAIGVVLVWHQVQVEAQDGERSRGERRELLDVIGEPGPRRRSALDHARGHCKTNTAIDASDSAVRARDGRMASLASACYRRLGPVRSRTSRRMLRTWREDSRSVARGLFRSRAFAVAAVLTLAAGAAAALLVFTLVRSVLFRPLPVRDQARADRRVARSAGVRLRPSSVRRSRHRARRGRRRSLRRRGRRRRERRRTRGAGGGRRRSGRQRRARHRDVLRGARCRAGDRAEPHANRRRRRRRAGAS